MENGIVSSMAVVSDDVSVGIHIRSVSCQDRKQKKADDAKRPPAQSAAEATRQMLESKVCFSITEKSLGCCSCTGSFAFFLRWAVNRWSQVGF